jgi:hypothetical protein
LTTLTMHEVMRSRENTNYGAGPIFRYKVDGMPRGQEAFIVNVNVGRPREALWRIDVGKKRKGNYKTAEEALAALQREIYEVRNIETSYAVCPERHLALLERRPPEFDTCTLCSVPKMLSTVGEGLAYPEGEKNSTTTDSLAPKTRAGLKASKMLNNPPLIKSVGEACASTALWKTQPSVMNANTQSLPLRRFYVVDWSSLSWCLRTRISSSS